jgi:hypothetical protein
MNDETPEDDDATRQGVGPVKGMILTCVLMIVSCLPIMAARSPAERRNLFPTGLAFTTGLMLAHYWQALSTLAHFAH